jgi:hypothetical protein
VKSLLFLLLLEEINHSLGKLVMQLFELPWNMAWLSIASREGGGWIQR